MLASHTSENDHMINDFNLFQQILTNAQQWTTHAITCVPTHKGLSSAVVARDISSIRMVKVAEVSLLPHYVKFIPKFARRHFIKRAKLLELLNTIGHFGKYHNTNNA